MRYPHRASGRPCPLLKCQSLTIFTKPKRASPRRRDAVRPGITLRLHLRSRFEKDLVQERENRRLSRSMYDSFSSADSRTHRERSRNRIADAPRADTLAGGFEDSAFRIDSAESGLWDFAEAIVC